MEITGIRISSLYQIDFSRITPLLDEIVSIILNNFMNFPHFRGFMELYEGVKTYLSLNIAKSYLKKNDLSIKK